MWRRELVEFRKRGEDEEGHKLESLQVFSTDREVSLRLFG